MEIEGKIILDLGEQSGTSKVGNPWKKHEWVLETFGNFARKVHLTVFGNKTETVNLEVGKSYKVSVDVESREFNGRWYTNVNAYAAQEIGAPQIQAPAQQEDPFGAAPQGFAPQPGNFASAPSDPFAGGSNETDDLPF